MSSQKERRELRTTDVPAHLGLKYLPDRLAQRLNHLFSMRDGAPCFAKDIDRIEELVFLAGAQQSGNLHEEDFDALYFLRQLKKALLDDELDPGKN